VRSIFFALLAACASKVDVVEPTAVPPEAPLIDEEPEPPEPELTRLELDATLGAGPARFLERVRVRAHRPGGRFVGWEIVGFRFPGDPIARAVAVGDIVRAVNGKPLERPEQFSAIWEGLRGASVITVELTRRGERLELAFPVVGP
jgi:hypothetical protein